MEKEAQNIQPITTEQLSRLRSAAGAGPVLIMTHDNPDPDALSSGKALATLLKVSWNISTRLLYSGIIARAENRTMLRLLTPEWELTEVIGELDQYSAVALVDTQPRGGNNRLPQAVIPQIVIDHHYPGREGLENVAYTDIRPEAGATVSLVYQYLDACHVVPDVALATAMFYGIQADTRGLSRGNSIIDQVAYFRLLRLIDRQVLGEVEQSGLPRDYFQAFDDGLKAARIYGHVVVAYLGAMHRPDFMSEMADILIRLENMRAALCLGHHGQTLYFSLRTASTETDEAGMLVQKIIMPPGKAGGHGTVAGGQVPLNNLNADWVAKELENRFLQVMGEDSEADLLLSSSM